MTEAPGSSPLGSSPFRWLLGGQVVSLVGSQLFPMVLVALTVSASDQPALTMGLVMGARFAAMALFIVLGGVLADRVDRFGLLALTDAVRIAALVPIMVLDTQTPLAVLAASSFVLGAGEALYVPTYDAAVVSSIDRGQLARANALTKATRGVAKVLGPPLAGIVVLGVGVRGAVIIDAVSFGLSLLTLVRLALMRLGPRPEPAHGSMWRDVLGGLRAVAGLRWLVALELMAMVHVLLVVAPWVVLLPVISERELGGIDSYGALLGAFAAGAIPGALLGAWVRPRRPGLVILGGLMPFGLCCIALAWSHELWVLIAVFFVAGAGTELTDIVKTTAIQEQVPKELLGRVFALDFFASYVMMPLGQLATGLLIVPGTEPLALALAGMLLLISTPLV
ncbi:MAG: MFS transporter, partial [Myxococcales bacterium]|nr:MFS transporter [Myxococcales bacterium]